MRESRVHLEEVTRLARAGLVISVALAALAAILLALLAGPLAALLGVLAALAAGLLGGGATVAAAASEAVSRGRPPRERRPEPALRLRQTH
jgi:hypothetical protein